MIVKVVGKNRDYYYDIGKSLKVDKKQTITGNQLKETYKESYLDIQAPEINLEDKEEIPVWVLSYKENKINYNVFLKNGINAYLLDDKGQTLEKLL